MPIIEVPHCRFSVCFLIDFVVKPKCGIFLDRFSLLKINTNFGPCSILITWVDTFYFCLLKKIFFEVFFVKKDAKLHTLLFKFFKIFYKLFVYYIVIFIFLYFYRKTRQNTMFCYLQSHCKQDNIILITYLQIFLYKIVYFETHFVQFFTNYFVINKIILTCLYK